MPHTIRAPYIGLCPGGTHAHFNLIVDGVPRRQITLDRADFDLDRDDYEAAFELRFRLWLREQIILGRTWPQIISDLTTKEWRV